MDKEKKISLADKVPIKISLITVKFNNSFNRMTEKMFKEKEKGNLENGK